MESTVDELSRKNVQALHAQINKLQKQLTMRQVEVSETENETKRKIAALEEAIEATQLEMEESLREKDKEIEQLKGSIDSKDRKAVLLEKEKEQLVLSMNDMMKSRRDEIDDLQKELMEMSTRSANQTREVQTLKLQLQESGYRKDEMDRLRARVTELGDLLTGRKDRTGSDLSSLEVENSDLRKKLRDAVTERQVAEDKLREYVEERGGSKQVQVLRERNAALKHEVEKLTKKIKKLTESFRVDSPQNHDNRGSTKGQKSLSQDPVAVEATRFVI
jgi:chromosome segregation ATPase